MTYEVEKTRSGRRLLTVVEIDLDYCTLTYSTAPCTASLGVTGQRKCYNTRVSCQDSTNYTPGVKTYRFCTPSTDLPVGLDAIPSLRGVSLSPARLDIGGGLGQRSSVTIALQDHTSHDRGVDKYWDQRENESDSVDSLLSAGDGAMLLINAAGDRLRIS